VSGAVSVQGLAVTLGDTVVLREVDLDVAAGEWVNVIGPNGAGKTTLLRALLGAVDFDGRIGINGRSDGDAMSRARAVAYVPQSPVVPPGVPVIDYVLLGRTPHRGLFQAHSGHDLDVAAEVLDRLDLGRFARREVNTLSGGERQRVVMARALAQESSIVLLDEPTTALDLGHQQDMLDLVDALRSERGLTVLATLHDLTLAARYGDRIAVLSDGIIVADGGPSDILTESLISAHFGADVRIIDDVDGPIIVPAVRRPNRESP